MRMMLLSATADVNVFRMGAVVKSNICSSFFRFFFSSLLFATCLHFCQANKKRIKFLLVPQKDQINANRSNNSTG